MHFDQAFFSGFLANLTNETAPVCLPIGTKCMMLSLTDKSRAP